MPEPTEPTTTPTTNPEPTTPATPEPQERRFSEADVNRIVQERLERERRRASEQAETERRQAEEAALQQQGEFRRLAEERATRLAELEPLATRAERYETALTAHLATLRQDIPAHLAALLDRLDPAEQLEYLTANREVLVSPPPAPNLNAGGVKRSGPVDDAAREQELRARFRL